MYPSQINNLEKEVEWWENKNEGKEIIYDVDYETEIVYNIQMGDIIHIFED